MHHHLRFLIKLAAVPAIAMIATSCSLTESPKPAEPQVSLKKGQFRYQLTIFTTDKQLDVTNSFPNAARIAGIYSLGEGEKLLARFKKDKDYHLDASELIVGKRNQKVSFSNFTNYRFPSKYSSAVFKRPRESGNSFPVTPATPTEFKTRKLGTLVQLEGRKENDETLWVSIELDKTALSGNLNRGKPITTEATNFWGRKVEVVLTENKMLTPVFRRFIFNSAITLRSGQFLLIEGSSTPSSKPLDTSTGPVEPANFIVLVQVEAAL